MKPGSVIVDMAAANGGKLELRRRPMVVSENGVRIIGHTDLAGRRPTQRRNCSPPTSSTCSSCSPGKDGHPVLDMDDEVVRV